MKIWALALSIFTCSCSWIKNHPDSMPEEFFESLIEQYTGLDIDFTSTDSKK